jgi:putative NADH-flavin reductase
MQITVLGASGKVGKATVREALSKGYQVKVLVRSPDKLGDLKDKVTIITGDLLDSLSVEQALQGSVAVLNAAGGVKEPDQYNRFRIIGNILTEQMKKLGIKRLISISGAVMNLPTEKLDLKRRIMKVFVSLIFRQMKQAQEAILPIIINDNDISWTFVRAAMISKKQGTGRVLASNKQMPGIIIMLEDLGKFMVEQITSTEWIKKAPLVASA